MRKFLSLALAICMVSSMSTVAFAAGTTGVSSGYSTTVTYSGTGQNYWELDVPSNMVPDSTDDVTLSGTWDGATVFIVDADDTVTMGNDINNDTEVLDITFAGIEQLGSNYTDFEIIEPISISEMPDVLFGNWRGVFNYYLTVEHTEEEEVIEVDSEGVYLIDSAADLFEVSDTVRTGDNNYLGVTLRLVDDIDMKNVPFTAIGTFDNQFQGTFDGDNFTISNLSVTATDAATNDNSSAGLFGVIGNEAVVKNLNIDGATISGTHYVGAVAGYVFNYGQVLDCTVTSAAINSTYYNSENSGDKAGAVVGNSNKHGVVKNCSAIDCTVRASRDAGQVVGAGAANKVENLTATNVVVSWNGVGANTDIRNEVVGRFLSY